jgi:tetratricopeptide (TPR) repeat protein
LTQFEAAQRLLPRAAAPRVNRAHILQMLGRPEEAIPVYREALALRPGLTAALLGLERAQEALRATDGREP